MAKVLSPGYVDTTYVGDPVLIRGKLNFAADWRIKKEGAGEMTLVNTTGDNDTVEEIMMNVTNITNVYDKTSVDSSAYAPSKRGVNIYTKITDIYSVVDDADSGFPRQLLPISVSITARVPSSSYITAAQVQAVVARAVSSLYDTGSETTTRLNAILRGSLKPSDL